ncbi:MAG TPA: gfo/Idh/MocA family oxidoreductase [Lentisphaeria bacterium]|nr:MAG: oxidoreductase [Lentisphaerae bacterium GWF2_49_21]HBC88480.1 gfo/Idh/MocA family oxidoreductase [Lentisphaeria bacterium]
MSAIKFGVCGLGRIGIKHARCFSQEKEKYELVAGCDREQERTSELRKDYGCAAYNDFGEFLRNPEMELTIIATRSLDHVNNAKQALAAGKYVLLEKPIAVTSDDFKKLKKLDRKYSSRLFFLHNHRFEPSFQSIQKIIASGILGDVQMVKIRRHHSFRRRGDWQTLLSCGGGQLSCWGPHIIDQALQFIHAPVKDIWSNLKRVNSLGDADDHVKIMLVGENGIVADLEISDSVALADAYCTIYGSRGSLICADEKNIQLKFIDPKHQLPERRVSPDLPPPGGGLGADEDFHWIQKTVKVEPEGDMWELVEFEIARHLYSAIRENVPFPVVNADALEVVRVTEAVKKQNPHFNWL